MRTSLRLIAAAVSMLTIGADMSALTTDEPITISGKEYTLRTYVRRDIGPVQRIHVTVSSVSRSMSM